MTDYSVTIGSITGGGIEGRVTELRVFKVIGVVGDCLAALGALLVRETDGLSREGKPMDPFTSTALVTGQFRQFPLL